MLNRLKQRKESGFTIIEVMIVLAIAGLILLIVFLAVPALQRSSRNTQRKNDATNIMSQISNYVSDNNGTIPNKVTISGGQATVSCATGTGVANPGNCSGSNTETTKVGYYTNVTVANTGGTTTAPDTNTLVYVAGYGCNANNNGLGSANSRQAAILYELEPNSQECVQQG